MMLNKKLILFFFTCFLWINNVSSYFYEILTVVKAKPRKNTNSQSTPNKKLKKIKTKNKRRKVTRPKKSKKKESLQSKLFSLNSSPTKTIKSVVVEQASVAINNGLKSSEKSQKKTEVDAAKIISNIGEYKTKISQLEQEITNLQKNHLDLIKQPQTSLSQKELEQIQKEIAKLEEQKDVMENTIGSLATTIAGITISQGADEKTASDVVNALVTQGFPGAQKAALILNTSIPLSKGIYHSLMQNYVSVFESDMTFYPAAGTWQFCTKADGTCYVRLETFTKNGYVFPEYRELILDIAVPGRPIEVIMDKIKAGEFEIGRYIADMKPQNWLVNLFG